jgi:mannose-1-phosphate guanylyltransferase
VVRSDFGWSDLGTWGSLYTHLPKDASENATVGEHVLQYDCARNVVHMHDGRLAVVQGLKDVILVSTPDALLVCLKKDEQKIKQFVNDVTGEWGDRYV